MMVAKPKTFPEPRPKGQLAKRFREEDRRSRRRRDKLSLLVALIPLLVLVVAAVLILLAGGSATAKEGGGPLGGIVWWLLLIAVPLQVAVSFLSVVLAGSNERRWINAIVSFVGAGITVFICVQVM